MDVAAYEDIFGGCGLLVHRAQSNWIRGKAGWGNVETASGEQCGAYVLQLAVLFDQGLLAEVPEKTIDRAVLTFKEDEELSGCPIDGGRFDRCWTNGSGAPVAKPEGCVVVRIPAVDWRKAPPTSLWPYTTDPRGPIVTRLGPREWDVTQPYKWQADPSSRGVPPTGSDPPPTGFGFLLTGWPSSLEQLTGDDNTRCVSSITNIKLNVTFTVPSEKDDEPFQPPK
jgi:hypothetical protein